MKHRSHWSEECDSNRFLSEFTYHGSSITAKCSGGQVNKKSGSINNHLISRYHRRSLRDLITLRCLCFARLKKNVAGHPWRGGGSEERPTPFSHQIEGPLCTCCSALLTRSIDDGRPNEILFFCGSLKGSRGAKSNCYYHRLPTVIPKRL